LATVLDSLSAHIINGSFIKVSSSVFLSNNRGRQFDHNHFQESFSGINPYLEHSLEKRFSLEIFLIILKNNFKMVEHLIDSFFVTVHDVSAESNDWLHDELHEASSEL